MLTKEPVVQIHISRFCNLKCLHCYSSSGPSERQTLSVGDVLHTTMNLYRSGYRRVSLSGGEPVIAPGFRDLVHGLNKQKFRVGVITNGSRPDPLIEAMSDGVVHHASVSFDGPEALHDKIRGRKGSFRAALETLKALADRGFSCGAVLSATKRSFPHLPDVVDMVIHAGATHVQLHPIASTGRAREQEETLGPELSREALLRLLAIGRLLQRIYPDIHIQTDVLLASELRHRTYNESGLISPLVIADDGALLPFCFDISRTFSLGQMGDPDLDFHLTSRLQELLRRTGREIDEAVATNFYRELAHVSNRGTVDNLIEEHVS